MIKKIYRDWDVSFSSLRVLEDDENICMQRKKKARNIHMAVDKSVHFF